MERVDIRIGPVAFDHADYDAENDVLYLHVGEPREAEGEETPEGHVLRFERGTQHIVGLTVLGAQAILDRDGEFAANCIDFGACQAGKLMQFGWIAPDDPRVGQASADDLAPALAAV